MPTMTRPKCFWPALRTEEIRITPRKIAVIIRSRHAEFVRLSPYRKFPQASVIGRTGAQDGTVQGGAESGVVAKRTTPWTLIGSGCNE